MINLQLAYDYEHSLWALNELMRRAVDGTVSPLFVDSTNNRVLIGTTTASGSNQFQVIGNGTFGGSVTASAYYGDGSQLTGLSAGSLTLVSTQSITASANSVSFTGLATGTSYHLRLSAVQASAAGFLRIRFNSDSGANYNSSQSAVRNDGAAAPTGNIGATFILLENEPNTGPQVGHHHVATMDFNTNPSDGTDVGITYSCHYVADTTTYWIAAGAGHYKGSSNLTSIQIITSAGGITGTISLYRVV